MQHRNFEDIFQKVFCSIDRDIHRRFQPYTISANVCTCLNCVEFGLKTSWNDLHLLNRVGFERLLGLFFFISLVNGVYGVFINSRSEGF